MDGRMKEEILWSSDSRTQLDKIIFFQINLEKKGMSNSNFRKLTAVATASSLINSRSSNSLSRAPSRGSVKTPENKSQKRKPATAGKTEINEEIRQEIRQAFDLFDTDKNGFLDYYEMKVYFSLEIFIDTIIDCSPGIGI
jgi:hypothetical protein